ncbi:hypothetical protein GYMLUDRAFT_240697 [Collybiopsis luxurians FD-317 M1]|nr:hypothetical protein GYMLUDRAFT_240697 [Collybiopsis luxurians FD-317 M1]
MEASVGEPFVLSSYGTTKKASKSLKDNSISSSVFASHHGAGGNSEGYVTVAAQGDGVHVLDLSTLHPIISHTLGPTTSFSCSAVTRSELQGADHICTTYATIASSSDISEDEYDRTVWMWRENLSSSIKDRATQKKKAITLSQAICGLYLNESIPSRVLATSSQGSVILLHDDLQVQAIHSTNCELIKSFVFSRKECAFLPSRSTPTAAIVTSFVSSNGSLRIQVLAVDSEDQFHEFSDIELPIKPEAVCDVSFSKSGFFSVLVKDGRWSAFELKPTDDSLYLIQLDTIHLSSLSFISSSSSAETAILSLGSSHILLGGFTGPPSNREIVLLLWDLSFSVLLSSRTLPLPSNVSSDKVSITLVDALSSSSILLLLSPITTATSDRRKSQSRSGNSTSTVWIVPMTVPSTSSIANALGRASAATPWLAVNDDGASSESLYDAVQTKVLNEMRSAMDRHQPDNANTAFFTWQKQEEAKAGTETETKPSGPLSSIYGYNFTKDVLNIVLQPSKPANTPYSSQVMQHLLEKNVVSTSMVDGGLLPLLRLRYDWKSIFLALSHVSDLQELEILECLCFVLARHRQAQRRPALADAMQVDSAPAMGDSTPTLANFFAAVLRYTHTRSSAVELRAAFRRYLSDVDDIVCLLEVMDTWLGQWAGRDVRLLPTNKMIKKNEHGVMVVRDKDSVGSGKEGEDIPSMLHITIFLQSLLDTSFLNLIQTPSSHRILKKIHTLIEPEIKYIEQTEQLRGPLEMFVRAQGKALKEAKAASEGVKAPVPDWRQRKKAMHEQTGMNIGLYQLEEMIF